MYTNLCASENRSYFSGVIFSFEYVRGLSEVLASARVVVASFGHWCSITLAVFATMLRWRASTGFCFGTTAASLAAFTEIAVGGPLTIDRARLLIARIEVGGASCAVVSSVCWRRVVTATGSFLGTISAGLAAGTEVTIVRPLTMHRAFLRKTCIDEIGIAHAIVAAVRWRRVSTGTRLGLGTGSAGHAASTVLTIVRPLTMYRAFLRKTCIDEIGIANAIVAAVRWRRVGAGTRFELGTGSAGHAAITVVTISSPVTMDRTGIGTTSLIF